MKITEFVYRFNKLGEDDTEAKVKMIKDHIKNTYIDHSAKIDSANKIVKFALYDENGNFSPNTPVREVLFANEIIRKYTDLEFSVEDSLHDYDLLVNSDILDIILVILAKDVERFTDVLDMVVADTYDKECNIINFLSTLLLQVSDVLNTAFEEQKE